MANLVCERPDAASFHIPELGRIRLKVEAALQGENAIIEWTRGSLLAAMYDYCDFFAKQDETISISPKARRLLTEDFVNAEFNTSLSPDVTRKMRGAIRDALFCAA
jgi:hypothetical protein